MVITRRMAIQTKGDGDTLDITPQVAREIKLAGVKDGLATIFVVGSTAGVTTIEHEPNLVEDFHDMWERVAPRRIPYRHSQTWGDDNGHSHVRASLLGPSLTIPIVGGAMTLGTWQQVVVVDFDNRPRSREVVLQIVAE